MALQCVVFRLERDGCFHFTIVNTRNFHHHANPQRQCHRQSFRFPLRRSRIVFGNYKRIFRSHRSRRRPAPALRRSALRASCSGFRLPLSGRSVLLSFSWCYFSFHTLISLSICGPDLPPNGLQIRIANAVQVICAVGVFTSCPIGHIRHTGCIDKGQILVGQFLCRLAFCF